MSVTIGDLIFDDVEYDAAGDVLYLSVGQPRAAEDALGTPEGHAVRYGPNDQIIGVTLINVKRLLERDGEVRITIPERLRVEGRGLSEALGTP